MPTTTGECMGILQGMSVRVRHADCGAGIRYLRVGYPRGNFHVPQRGTGLLETRDSKLETGNSRTAPGAAAGCLHSNAIAAAKSGCRFARHHFNRAIAPQHLRLAGSARFATV